MKNINVVFEGNPVCYKLEYDDKNADIKKGQVLLIESSRGLELVKAVSSSYKDEKEAPLKKETNFEESIQTMDDEKLSFIRIATQKDIDVDMENKNLTESIKKETKKLVQKYNLEMKISGIRITLDKSKVVIYFTAEIRVDFRELVKELASIFKSRIELRQVGSRDESRLMGGIGPCEINVVAKIFLNDFGHVSIKCKKSKSFSEPNKN
jgi:cell fate regulator YaaT (PSP1 superfamily)